MDTKDIIAKMTLEEKAGLCSGKDFWNLKGIERLGIPEIMVTDGPHGLRKQGSEADHVGINESLPATCFPTPVTMASSWDTQMVNEIGAALGEECRQEKVAVLLGPGANIKRSPLCGRNFEYFSEDPFLTGRMAAAMINGVQSQGIGTSLKHFAVNNQEKRRMTINAVVDERALREIYLAGFEEAVKSAQPDTVMCAYNRINGEYCSENEFLLTDVLKKEWNHKGLVVTDWGAANDRVKGLKAGLELEMPGNGGINDREIIRAVESGELDEDVLDRAVERILNVIIKTSETLKEDFTYDSEAHHELAKKAAVSSAVLLKNNGILPLDRNKSVAVIGHFAVKPRFQGSGSSLINPIKVDNFSDSLKKILAEGAEAVYAEGYDPEREDPDPILIKEAVRAAESAEIALVFAGLPEVSESEGFDRTTLDMPPAHNKLIEAVCSVNPNTVVILSNGAPVTMPWLDGPAAVLESYLGGQAWGGAVADLLYGIAVPSGKLAETFPLSLDEDPAAPNFPGGSASVPYAESIYVGYRYYDRINTGSGERRSVLFPFGYGLSYSTFEYSDLAVKKPEAGDSLDEVRVSFTVKNNGPYDAAEIAQVYVRDVESSVFRPEKELKGFVKVELDNGQSREVTVALDRRAFSFWDSGNHAWVVEAGEFEILVGSSSADIRLQAKIDVESGDSLSSWASDLRETVPEYYAVDTKILTDLSPSGPFARLLGRELPPRDIPKDVPFDRTSSMDDVRGTFVGKLLYAVMRMNVKKMIGKDADERMVRMMEAIVREMPLRSMIMMSGGAVSGRQIDALLTMMNGKFFKGLMELLKTSR